MVDTPATVPEPEKTDNVVTPDDKQVLLDDLRKTMHDMGRIPAMLMAPVITYIASQYEKIPEGRRKKLQAIVSTLKTKGAAGLVALKKRSSEANAPTTAGAVPENNASSVPLDTEPKKKIPTQKKTPAPTKVSTTKAKPTKTAPKK